MNGTTNLDHFTVIGVALLVLHLYLGGMIFTHGFRKAFKGGRIAGTARWLDSIGVRPGRPNAYAAAITEMGAGVLLTLGLLTPLASAGVVALMLVAIVTVHRKNGFMITNPGGGVEYCAMIAVASLTLGTLGSGRFSLDNALEVLRTWSPTTNFLVTLIVGVGGAVLQLATTYRPRVDP